jgi:hypothetical protein
MAIKYFLRPNRYTAEEITTDEANKGQGFYIIDLDSSMF